METTQGYEIALYRNGVRRWPHDLTPDEARACLVHARQLVHFLETGYDLAPAGPALLQESPSPTGWKRH